MYSLYKHVDGKHNLDLVMLGILSRIEIDVLKFRELIVLSAYVLVYLFIYFYVMKSLE